MIFATAVCFARSESQIHISKGKYKNFHHIEFILTRENSVKPFGQTRYGPRKFEIVDGQFEVFIKKSTFPVPAPDSKKGEYLILRMPSGKNETKTAIFNSIDSMFSSKIASVKVIIELDPYFDPERKQLSENNIFFRTAGGKYIDFTGELKKQHPSIK